MYGGDGDDTYYIDDLGDAVIEDTNDAIGGIDLVFSQSATPSGSASRS